MNVFHTCVGLARTVYILYIYTIYDRTFKSLQNKIAYTPFICGSGQVYTWPKPNKRATAPCHAQHSARHALPHHVTCTTVQHSAHYALPHHVTCNTVHITRYHTMASHAPQCNTVHITRYHTTSHATHCNTVHITRYNTMASHAPQSNTVHITRYQPWRQMHHSAHYALPHHGVTCNTLQHSAHHAPPHHVTCDTVHSTRYHTTSYATQCTLRPTTPWRHMQHSASYLQTHASASILTHRPYVI